MAKANIMIVEDEVITAMAIENLVKKFGYGVSARVSCGEDAIQKAKENTPDLILSETFNCYVTQVFLEPETL